jgi:dTDP-4-dehydrorhamnose 3,5-epimerase
MEFRIPSPPLSGLAVLKRQCHTDERGSLERLFAAEELAVAGLDLEAVHINLTRTTHAGTVKGLHFQRQPHAEAKIVSCIAGRIFDVAVDLRPASPTYGKWFGLELSPDRAESLLIPEGFAHGMQCLEPNSIVHYVHAAAYAPNAESGVHPLDPDVAVAWPLPPRYLSQRDQSLPWLADLGEVAR